MDCGLKLEGVSLCAVKTDASETKIYDPTAPQDVLESWHDLSDTLCRCVFIGLRSPLRANRSFVREGPTCLISESENTVRVRFVMSKEI